MVAQIKVLLPHAHPPNPQCVKYTRVHFNSQVPIGRGIASSSSCQVPGMRQHVDLIPDLEPQTGNP